MVSNGSISEIEGLRRGHCQGPVVDPPYPEQATAAPGCRTVTRKGAELAIDSIQLFFLRKEAHSFKLIASIKTLF